MTSLKSSFKEILAKVLVDKSLYFSDSTIKKIISENRISITNGTLSLYLFEAVKSGLIFDAGRGWYSSIPRPFVLATRPVNRLISLLSGEFPLLDFSVWSTEQLNSFTQHIMTQFLTFVYTERDCIEPVSEFLKDQKYSVYADPGKEIVKKMFRITPKTVVIRKQITKQPKGEGHTAPIEKILVDLLWESRKIPFIDESEVYTICNNVTESGRVGFAGLLGYAKRRSLDFNWLNLMNPLISNTIM